MIRPAKSLLDELQAIDESASIDAKTASCMGSAVLETVCAFSNEPGLGGGHLLLGVSPSQQAGLFGATYDVVGITDPDRLQADLASQCASVFNRPVRPQVAVERLQGKLVLVVFVPELAPTDKPLFIERLGLPRGAFRRIGSTDQHGTEDDLVALYQGHDAESYDGTTIADSDWNDVDPEAVRTYRELRSLANPDAEELAWSDADLLRALGAITLTDGSLTLTVSGLLLFGTPMALRRCFPMMRIDYIRVPGREWVKDPERRFDSVEIRAPLILATRRAINAVRDDLPSSFSLPEGETFGSNETVLPSRVLREAVVNAVMHRSYRIQGPIQILRYSNRLEIRNPGHSLKAIEQLGSPGSQTRNPRIAAVLHEVQLAETKGSGIRAMRELMHAHNLLQPAFESSRHPDQFVGTFLFHHFLGEGDLVWLSSLTAEKLSDEESRALVFVREAGAIDNATYRAINQVETLEASVHLRRLRDLELLAMKGGGNRTYYIPGPRFGSTDPVLLAATDLLEAPSDAEPAPILTTPTPDPHHPPAQSTPPLRVSSPPDQAPGCDQDADLRPPVPPQLQAMLPTPGSRPRRKHLRSIILALCSWRPLSSRELAHLLGDRDPKFLVREHLAPMIKTGELSHTIPEMLNHPEQKYRSTAATG